ncbi:cytochrome b/b6 domain-containing protein [Methylomonas sp. AM2-LC]|uniref:cytochrome b/b6 domain-containing protein n=1 Tax=Methylomonas sp. AM2-LC TaxID=3153301 RepID=UPI003266ED17
MKVSVHIWDWPLRLFHWLLVLVVVGSYITGKLGGSLTDWHGRLGSLALGLIIFRLIWGFIGTTHARFSSFFPTILRLKTYVKGEWQGVGHNPVGALAVIALLISLSLLVVTGLFANDDIAFEGPLFHLVDKDISDKLSGWHISLVNILILLVAIHVCAIVFYHKVKKTNLIVPMITGKKDLPKSFAPVSITAVSLLRFTLTLIVSASLVWGVWNGGLTKLLTPQASIQRPATQTHT